MRNKIKNVLKKTGLFPHAKATRNKIKSFFPTQRAHQKKMLSFYSEFIKPDDLVFDVGANIGNRTDIFLGLGARVVSIDPQPSCIEQLNIKYRNNKKVNIVGMGLGAAPGVNKLNISNADTISTMSEEWLNVVKQNNLFAGATWDNFVEVPITTLDILIESYGTPVFCKIDVEGFELEVVKGLSSIIPVISFEFLPEHKDAAIDVLNQLDKLGDFLCNVSLGESMKMHYGSWISLDDFMVDLASDEEFLDFGDIYIKYK